MLPHSFPRKICLQKLEGGVCTRGSLPDMIATSSQHFESKAVKGGRSRPPPFYTDHSVAPVCSDFQESLRYVSICHMHGFKHIHCAKHRAPPLEKQGTAWRAAQTPARLDRTLAAKASGRLAGDLSAPPHGFSEVETTEESGRRMQEGCV